MSQKEFDPNYFGMPAKQSKPGGELPQNRGMRYLGILILTIVAFSVGIFTGRSFELTTSTDTRIPKLVNFSGDRTPPDELVSSELDFNLFWNVWDQVKNGYVDGSKVDENEMFYGAIKGMVSSYGDPATIFLNPTETDTFKQGTAGNFFSGIGAEMGYRDGVIVVISPLKGSPAAKAGIRPGDALLSVDGEDVKSTDSLFEVVTRIRGEEGTDVKLGVLQAGATEIREITITRGQITVSSMEFEISEENSDIAVFDLSRFTETDLQTWQRKWDGMVDQFEQSGAEALVIDLRGNPGGYFNAAVYAANEFLEKGKIISKQEDQQGKITDFKVTRKGRLIDVPVVILVNNGSASASEILAGALQLNGRADVIGIPTYGKGTAQDIRSFSNGSSLHLTILKWLLPDGSWLNPENPIQPDINVEITDEDFKRGIDPQMDIAIQILEDRV